MVAIILCFSAYFFFFQAEDGIRDKLVTWSSDVCSSDLIQNGIFPDQWKKANVAAIYKNKGSKSDVENYRPISVLPMLGRVLEKAVCTQLQQYCDINEIIPPQQFGFRKNSSCELTLIAALDTWLKDVAHGQLVGALLIDLSKAFDSISHAQLIQDLVDIGCSHQVIRWFSSYLSSRQQRVKSGDIISSWMPVGKGVPQGSPLSPLLFNIAIRKLPQRCDTDLYQFADDLTTSASDKDSYGLASKLQRSYEMIKHFCEERNLHINTTKTQLIIFKSPHQKIPENFSISLDGCSVASSLMVKLLGVTLDHHFTMGQHIDEVVKKCHGLLGMLRRAASCLPRDLLKMIYVALIRSQIEYCSATFASAAPTHLNKLDVIQKIASRIITGSPSQTHSAPLQLQLGLDSLHSRRVSHVSSVVENILNKKTHPFFVDFFKDGGNISRGANLVKSKTLQLKRFSNFGLSTYNDYINSLGAPPRPFHITLLGQTTDQHDSQSLPTATLYSTTIQRTTANATPG